jgi:hypothetical protein
VVPLVGVTVNQLPPDAAAVNDTGAPADTVTVCAWVLKSPLCAINWSEPGMMLIRRAVRVKIVVCDLPFKLAVTTTV